MNDPCSPVALSNPSDPSEHRAVEFANVWLDKQRSADRAMAARTSRHFPLLFHLLRSVLRDHADFHDHALAVDSDKKSLVLSTSRRKDWKTNFGFQQPAGDQLRFDGEMDSHKIHVRMHRIDPAKQFPLLASKFYWINEYPFNR